ncbi:hypothetical protein GCM10010399_31710 [Dactylosporangium fulvum]|uniref:Polysaccharide chain length determinant N-terminal domain-containing protein n=1 Tax=Dactylosporangium fulvum TaxID=53359 RepID=A0ABY5W4P4_9ACTN|nr:hypothetical protein [Dactylosporangium fulvum]UWP83984.1 hypothetical protein Dfulv_06945 [Dactylosporangium fulvum]
MDLWDLAKLMGRRWYLMAPMILLTLAATTWALVTIKPDYTSTGTIMLIPPANRTPLTQAELASTNTWVEVGEDIMATAVAISLNTSATKKEIAAGGFSSNFEVVAEDRSSILTVTATASTPEAAKATVQRLEKQVAQEVEDKQARYKPQPGRAITTQVLDPGDTIEVVSSKVKRAAVVIIGVGLLLTAAVTIVGDNLLRRRASTRRRAAGLTGPDDLEPDGGTDVIADSDRVTRSRIPTAANGREPRRPINLSDEPTTIVTNHGGKAKNHNMSDANGSGLTVSYKQVEGEGDRRGGETDDATIILPLGNTPWAGRDADAEARNR